MNINVMQQMVNEDKYSRKNIREKVGTDIINTSDNRYMVKFLKACEAIEEYLEGDYYTSKQVRVNHLRELLEKDLYITDIVTEMLIVIMPVSGAQMIQGVCGQLAPMLKYEDIFDGIKTAAELLAVVCESDLFDIIPPRDSETGSLMVQSNYTLSEETLQFISQTQYLPPMICKPREVTNNQCNAHITFDDSVILGKRNHHNKALALDALNIANGVKLTLDEEMLEYEEISDKPLDTMDKKANFNRRVLASKQVCRELIEARNEFYLTWKFDKRGRMYSQGYHVNIQGKEHSKAVLSLSKKEVITG